MSVSGLFLSFTGSNGGVDFLSGEFEVLMCASPAAHQWAAHCAVLFHYSLQDFLTDLLSRNGGNEPVLLCRWIFWWTITVSSKVGGIHWGSMTQWNIKTTMTRTLQWGHHRMKILLLWLVSITVWFLSK